jgi:hypothetical protein
MASSAVTGTTGTIIARPVADLAGDGEAALETLQQLAVSVAYHDLYEVTLSAADSTKLANAFTQSGAGNSFTVTLSNSADFQSVLTANLPIATCMEWTSKVLGVGVAEDEVTSISKTLENAVAAEFHYTFDTLRNTLPNILETDGAYSNTIEWADGASSMAGLLTNEECEILAQQLPEVNYDTYKKGGENPTIAEDPSTSSLQLLNGDSIVFVFSFVQATTVRTATKTDGAQPDTATGVTIDAGGAFGTGAGKNSVSYNSNSRTVAFKVNVRNAGNVPGKLDGLTAI